MSESSFDSLLQERDRLAGVREEEMHQHSKCLESLGLELERARTLAEASRGDATAAESARADVERRLTEVEDRLRTAIETSNCLDSEAQAARAQLTVLEQAADQSQAAAADLEAARLRIEVLSADLRQARIANEQLRALLNVFGLVENLEFPIIT